jgi:hypothetical protein
MCVPILIPEGDEHCSSSRLLATSLPEHGARRICRCSVNNVRVPGPYLQLFIQRGSSMHWEYRTKWDALLSFGASSQAPTSWRFPMAALRHDPSRDHRSGDTGCAVATWSAVFESDSSRRRITAVLDHLLTLLTSPHPAI